MTIRSTMWYKNRLALVQIRARDQFVGGAGRVSDDETRAAQGFESAGKDLSDAKRVNARKHTGRVSRNKRGTFIHYMRESFIQVKLQSISHHRGGLQS